MRTLIKCFLVICVVFVQAAFAEQKIVEHQSVKLMTESFGAPENPAVLLIMGAGASKDFWPDSLVDKLSKQGFFVIRFDHRDTGESTHVDYQKNPYDLNDLTKDALAILDAYHIQKANVVGFSLGGFIGQLLEIHHPERLKTVTLIGTTAYYAPLMEALSGQPNPSDLPSPDPVIIAKINQLLAYQPKNEADQIKQMVAFQKQISGSGPFDEAYWDKITKRSLKRDIVKKPNFNHVTAQKVKMEDWRPSLKKVEVPTLIIQGQEDPFFPEPHGKEMAKALKNSQLVEIPHMGHVIAPYYEDQFLKVMIPFWKSHNNSK